MSEQFYFPKLSSVASDTVLKSHFREGRFVVLNVFNMQLPNHPSYVDVSHVRYQVLRCVFAVVCVMRAHREIQPLAAKH